MNPILKSLIIGLLFISFTGCGGIENTQYFQYLSTTSEAALCADNFTYATSVKVVGTATFFKRGINLVVQPNPTTQLPELKNLTLGDPLQSALPIRQAEVAIYNSKNQIVQCGRTNDTGILKATDGISDLLIPATPDTYSVQVRSRSTISLAAPGKPLFQLNASVKKDIYTNQLYILAKNLFSNGVDDLSLSLIAYARQTESDETNGGAFNILNDIYTTYLYIKNNTGTVDTQCLNKKINTYWKAGFNPFQYLYPEADSSTLGSNSYYDQAGDKSLFITGGRLGNTSFENTDHFDDYVIIHELSHFIEDNCGQLLTPGGTHALVSRIDPRLAWSEGWANFMASQVMYNSLSQINPEFENKMVEAGFIANATAKKWSFLSSTSGFSDSQLNIGNGTGFMFDLKKSGANPDSWQEGPNQGSAFDKVDAGRYRGEGHFREGAITRGFFKLANACGSTCATAPLNFETFWNAMNKITGAGADTQKFKSSHTVLENVRSTAGGSWSGNLRTLAEGEALHLNSDSSFLTAGLRTWTPYGSTMLLQPGACPVGTQIEPRIDDPILSGSNSDQRYSNHYYTLDFSVTPTLDTIGAKFTKVAGSDVEFDLILFQEDYFFNTDYFCSAVTAQGTCATAFVPSRALTSDIVRSDRTSGLISYKKITNLQTLDRTKKYLLNVRAYTPSKSIASTTLYTYELRDSLTVGTGNYLCF